tara:strand:- start:1202 stop:1363 length:162 start_codon:yes stop_codon:yes gene_type:complete
MDKKKKKTKLDEILSIITDLFDVKDFIERLRPKPVKIPIKSDVKEKNKSRQPP